MTRVLDRRTWVIALACIAGAPALARAQVPSGGYGAGAGMAGNPYANLYLNPFLGSYMGQANSIAPNNTMLYMMMAQQMSGGIGSGQISGVRPGPAGARQAPATPPASRGLGVPSGRAGRYFNRSYDDGGGTSRYYSRQNSYFPRSR